MEYSRLVQYPSTLCAKQTNVINYLTIKNLTIIWLQMVDILINYEVRSLTLRFTTSNFSNVTEWHHADFDRLEITMAQSGIKLLQEHRPM